MAQGYRPTEEEGECPPDLLECPCAEKLNFWLARFVVECRRVDAGLLGSMFSGLNECSIQIAPQSMVVNIMQSPQSQSTGK